MGRGLLLALALTAMLGGCGGSSHAVSTPTTHGTAPLCDSVSSCVTMYEHGGATPKQAACIAPIYRPPLIRGVNDGALFRAEDKCVGSMKRFLAITAAAAAWAVRQH